MNLDNFIVVGENIHCSRIVKRNGKHATTFADGSDVVNFTYRGDDLELPVPENWGSVSPAFTQEKIKHVALAIHQALNGTTETQETARAYLCWLAERQIEAGTWFLDINVDEYSSDAGTSAEVMSFLADFYAQRFETPLSLDSSNPKVLEAGLEKHRTDTRPPMVNSVSLERPEVADLVKHYQTDVIVNASGAEGMPGSVEERMNNFRQIMTIMDTAGVLREKMHLDPLVLPISTDPQNGASFLDTTRQAAAEFEGVHLNGGLSNISFGMPRRKLLNLTFIRLCADAGTDGGIIDPCLTPPAAAAEMDTDSEASKLAKAVLTGEDMFGMEYITAHREGRL
ncbi:MAG: dihydropteroate synthase [Lentisphaeria bacterium]